jgi:hypothetical protein
MGLGLTDSDYNQYYISIKSQKVEGATKIPYSHLVVQKKVNGDLRTQKDERGISGFIRAISHSTYDWEGAEQKVLSLKLIEGNDLFKIDCNIDSTIGRNLANTILTLTPEVTRLHLRCYDKKSKTDGKTYPHIWIGSSDEQEDGLKWAFTLDDVKHLIRKVEDPTKPGSGKMITINHDLNMMLWNKWLELEKELNPIYKELEDNRRKRNPKQMAAVTADRADAPDLQNTVDEFDPGMEPAEPSVDNSNDELPF